MVIYAQQPNFYVWNAWDRTSVLVMILAFVLLGVSTYLLMNGFELETVDVYGVEQNQITWTTTGYIGFALLAAAIILMAVASLRVYKKAYNNWEADRKKAK